MKVTHEPNLILQLVQNHQTTRLSNQSTIDGKTPCQLLAPLLNHKRTISCTCCLSVLCSIRVTKRRRGKLDDDDENKI